MIQKKTAHKNTRDTAGTTNYTKQANIHDIQLGLQTIDLP